MKELTCIICPRGCRLCVDDNMEVVGNFCPRGAKYAKEELTCPKRMITSIIRVVNRKYTMASVKTSGSIPKELLDKAIEIIKNVKVEAPVKVGDIAYKNILDTGIDLIITKNIK